MSADAEKHEIAAQFLAGLRARDWVSLKSLMTGDATWSMPGASLISGEAKGADAVIARWQTIVAHGMNFELKHLLIGLNGFALSLHNTARHEGRVFDMHLVTVMNLRDGRIFELDTHMSDIGMLNAFFISK